MSDEKKPAVPALWFDKDGCGPDCLAIRPHHFKSKVMPSGGLIEATLGLRIESRPDSLPVLLESGRRMVEGGFVMDRESVQQLAAGLDDWLEVTAPPDAGPRRPKAAFDVMGQLWPAVEAANGTIHLVAGWYMSVSARENSIAAVAQRAREVCKGSGWVVSSVYGHEFNIQCPKDGT